MNDTGSPQHDPENEAPARAGEQAHSHADHSHSGHSHAGHAHAGHSHAAGGNLAFAFALNLAFTLIEIAGGLWTNSVAILSDAVHDLGDSLSLGLAWYFARVSRRAPTARHTYGWRRYSLLGGLVTSAVLIAGMGVVVWHAVERLAQPQAVYAPGMIALAVVGIVVNGAAVLRVRRGSSLTERVVSWHLLEDVLGWAAVLVGAIAMAIWGLPWLDPVLSIAISVFIAWNVLRNLRHFVDVFLQKAPRGFDMDHFEHEVRALPGVRSTHHTHSWTVDGERHVLTTHVVLDGHASRESVVQTKAAIRAMLEPRDFFHVTIDVELEGEPCAQPGA